MQRIRNFQFLIIMGFITTLLVGCQNVQDSIYDATVSLGRSKADLQLKEVIIDDMTYSILEGGNPEGETILMVHGFSAHKDNWLLLSDRLSDDFHIIAIDLAGHGDSSSGPELDYSIPKQVDRVNDILNALKPGKVHYMGNSMGGAIGLFFADQYPQHLKSLTLIDNAGIESPTPSEYFLLLEKGQNPLIPRKPGDFDVLVNFVMSDVPFMPWPIPAVLERKSLQRTAINEQIFADMMKSREEIGSPEYVRNVLEDIRVPTLVIWGEEDRVLDVSSIEIMEAHIPNMQAVILPGIGHVPMMESPKQVAEAFRNFSNQL
ncbi:alpha/beta hydrolase [Sansalvadorimonas sp. 2012CJ34-2]|uniref:Alpha/beta hydrolase n=1 Tax=Parendozoicomonas callyspongiae TaxID=2942213 RepID=A0ABT0PIG0_9GAMM|nr:alpha/beta hydrolase [Sansalvadorimonas sp. 2012CJ34-2]MCL6271164.1 alpha/beta hydrolase [Sansalvadorimonas sp. 2012CJ34-2]